MKIKIKRKSSRQLATDVDIKSAKGIIEVIREKFPEHSVLSEECGKMNPLIANKLSGAR